MTALASNAIPLIYCDWNVFNKIEHVDTLDEPERSVYREIHWRAVNNEIVIPYSNAHINDLLRGYLKNPDFTPGHLENITTITNNLCIANA